MSITETQFIGKIWFHFNELPSTNSYAAEYLSQKSLEGAFLSTQGSVFTTFNQTAGRGQRDNNWQSAPDKNLAFTVILHPRFLSATQQFCISIAVALAVQDTIKDIFEAANKHFLVNQLKIKWPNDIYIGDKKIAGILIQNTLQGATIQASIVGIGINVNQTDFEALPQAGALQKFTGAYIDLYNLTNNLCIHIEKRFLELKAGAQAAQQELFKTHLYRINTPALYRRLADDLVFEGIIRNVTLTGGLVIEDKLGLQTFNLHELRFLNTDDYKKIFP